MKPNQLCFFLLFLVGTTSFSQVGIGISNPDPSAVLHLESSNKGFLPPKISLISNSDGITIPNPANGLVVFNISTTFGTQGLYLNQGTPEFPSWRALQTQAIGGSIIEYNDIISSPTNFNIRSLPDGGNWIEIIDLRESFFASAGSNMNVSLHAMVEVWNTSGAASFQNDYLIVITQNLALASTLPRNSYNRNGVVISRTTNDGSSVAIFDSQALSYNFSSIAATGGTYYVQTFIRRSNTPTNPTNAWEIINSSINLLITK